MSIEQGVSAFENRAATLGERRTCLVSEEDSLIRDFEEHWSLGDLEIKHRLCDLLAAQSLDCGLYIVDTRVSDMDIWPAPFTRWSDALHRNWYLLVSKMGDVPCPEYIPLKIRFFEREGLTADKLIDSAAKEFDDELARRIVVARYVASEREFIIRMESGKQYFLRLRDLREADDSEVTEVVVSEDQSYFKMSQASGNCLEIPWDVILYHCEPAYRYYKHRQSREGVGNEGVGARLRQIRKARGLSMAELARHANMHRPNVSRLEHGKYYPSLTTLERLAEALDVPVAEIVQRRSA